VRMPRRFAGELAQCLLHFRRRDEREEDASGGFGGSQRRTIVGGLNGMGGSPGRVLLEIPYETASDAIA